MVERVSSTPSSQPIDHGQVTTMPPVLWHPKRGLVSVTRMDRRHKDVTTVLLLPEIG